MEASITLDTINALCAERQKLWRAPWTKRNTEAYRDRLQHLDSRIKALWHDRRVEMAGSIPTLRPDGNLDYTDLGNRTPNGGSAWRRDKNAPALPYSHSDWDEEEPDVQPKPAEPLRVILARRGKTLTFTEPRHGYYTSREVNLTGGIQ